MGKGSQTAHPNVLIRAMPRVGRTHKRFSENEFAPKVLSPLTGTQFLVKLQLTPGSWLRCLGLNPHVPSTCKSMNSIRTSPRYALLENLWCVFCTTGVFWTSCVLISESSLAHRLRHWRQWVSAVKAWVDRRLWFKILYGLFSHSREKWLKLAKTIRKRLFMPFGRSHRKHNTTQHRKPSIDINLS